VFTPLPREFYLPSAEIVAPLLLGHYLLRRTQQGIIGGLIVETEAYLYNDPACHAAVKETARNRSMFGDCGRSYVYLIYGMHYCFNAVCCEEGKPEAVLIRAIEPTFGQEIIQANRPNKRLRDLTNGPAKLCDALRIDRSFDEVSLCDGASSLFIAKNPEQETLLRTLHPVVQTTRIGITKAADWELRWYLGGSEFVSKR